MGAAAAESMDIYLGEIGKSSLLTEAEENSLARRAHDGDEWARHKLVARNLRFVVAVAKRYQHRGLALDDLIGEGNVGLVAAASRFDPAQGVRFITYAVWWVRQAILLALMKQTRIVRIPPSRLAQHARLARARDALRNELLRQPTPAEVAAKAGLTPSAVTEWYDLQSIQISLDPAPSSADRSIGEQLVAEPSEDPLDENEESVHTVARALASLQPREAQILRSYFGLEGRTEQTLDAIATQMGITRERVRQIRDRAIGRLRHGSHAAALFTLER